MYERRPSLGEIPFQLTLTTDRVKQAEASDEKWSVLSFKNDLKVMAYDFNRAWKLNKKVIKPQILGICVLVFLISLWLRIPGTLVLAGFGYLFYRSYKDSYLLEPRFSQVKSRYFVP
jgi:hypothetical protein